MAALSLPYITHTASRTASLVRIIGKRFDTPKAHILTSPLTIHLSLGFGPIGYTAAMSGTNTPRRLSSLMLTSVPRLVSGVDGATTRLGLVTESGVAEVWECGLHRGPPIIAT